MLEFIARVFDAAAGTPGGRVVGILLLVALALAAGWLVARGLARVRRDRGRALEVEGPAGRSAQDWLGDAQAHTRAGEHREALRCQYRAVLAWLDEQGLVEEVPGTTTGEYRRAVAAAAPEADGAFSELTGAFEEAWYGRRPVTADDVGGAADAAARVRSAARRPAPSVSR